MPSPRAWALGESRVFHEEAHADGSLVSVQSRLRVEHQGL